MKKISKFGLMLGVALLTVNMNAGTVDSALSVKEKKVTFVSNEMDKVDLSIYDSEGKLLHSEMVDAKKNPARTFDLKALPEGTYFLETETDVKVSRYKISVLEKTASLSTTVVSEIYKPAFVNKKGLIMVSILNLDKSPVNIKIYDKANNEVYDSDVLMEQDVKKVFDINNLLDEEYTFVMSYKDKTYSKTFASN
ncbi:T9SS type A sorting domain-containing protein [Flavobacterium eburneipallidum]|uniref:T9SS type A sorting domain-containing protein n=1 Tax=Flavobacterium eburneipallidum TaxID=3003263 RepID=UPI002482EFF7|nr:T9SS type A sorting domain-containing protein [Flavobacterium eburneipallidum]